MTVRSTYEAAVTAAGVTQTNARAAAYAAAQAAASLSRMRNSYVPGFSTGETQFLADQATATTTLTNALASAEAAKQSTQFTARSTAVAGGETGGW